MATGRIIKKNIFTSKKLNSLSSDFVENLYYKLIINADDWGKGSADPYIIKAYIFPLRHNVSLKKIENALQELRDKHLICYWNVGNEKYYYIINFRKYQRGCNNKSKDNFPNPPKQELEFHNIGEIFSNIDEISTSTVTNSGEISTNIEKISPNNDEKSNKQKKTNNTEDITQKAKNCFTVLDKPNCSGKLNENKTLDKICSYCIEHRKDFILPDDKPNTYLDCTYRDENNNCYFKNNGIKKYDFCLLCAQDKNIWGEQVNKWGMYKIVKKEGKQ